MSNQKKLNSSMLSSSSSSASGTKNAHEIESIDYAHWHDIDYMLQKEIQKWTDDLAPEQTNPDGRTLHMIKHVSVKRDRTEAFHFDCPPVWPRIIDPDIDTAYVICRPQLTDKIGAADYLKLVLATVTFYICSLLQYFTGHFFEWLPKPANVIRLQYEYADKKKAKHATKKLLFYSWDTRCTEMPEILTDTLAYGTLMHTLVYWSLIGLLALPMVGEFAAVIAFFVLHYQPIAIVAALTADITMTIVLLIASCVFVRGGHPKAVAVFHSWVVVQLIFGTFGDFCQFVLKNIWVVRQ